LLPETQPIDQPQRTIDPGLARAIIAGGYWLSEPGPGADLATAYCGAVASEALAANQAVAEGIPGAGLLAITSPGRLHRGWWVARAHGEADVAERLLARLRPGAALVTVGDFHPTTLSWLGAAARNTIVPLGIDRFGQSGDIPDLYRAYGIDTDAILDAPPAPTSLCCEKRHESLCKYANGVRVDFSGHPSLWYQRCAGIDSDPICAFAFATPPAVIDAKQN
jgi:pyruvate dehydrogenase complex dehydrogenase (E1) component